ncbi:MAG: hypothetical protein K2O91_22040 [Lachnospiraceae bacterium]|nr:hypothetical protein [Lachnospiraceae bacterium]
MRNKMVDEAVKRMSILGLFDLARAGRESIIQMFKEEGKVFVSKPGMGNRVGVLHPLNVAEQKLVDEFEAQYGALVYHVIRNCYDFGVCYSFLYVSKDEDDWNMDRNDIQDMKNGFGAGNPMAYVINVGYVPESATELSGDGEFKQIMVLNGSGGIVRKG